MKKAASAADVAEYLLSKSGPMSSFKLQKLVYYTQAWSLAWTGKPMFEDPIEAWVNGPVIPNLYERHRGAYTVHSVGGDKSALTAPHSEQAERVLEAYGGMTPHQLVTLTHHEEPWIAARQGLSPTERGRRVIEPRAMMAYYRNLLNDPAAQQL